MNQRTPPATRIITCKKPASLARRRAAGLRGILGVCLSCKEQNYEGWNPP